MKRLLAAALAALLLFACGCGPKATPPEPSVFPNTVFYEIFIGAFCDSDGDGTGDLPGVTSKLDYLKDLGVGGIWLTPINPSPSYHKYDVTDYYSIDPAFGTMEDFEALLAAAAERGIAVLLDLVLNHTSSRHPWFLAAQSEIRDGAEPRYRNYYNFSEEKPGADWYYLAGMYYEGSFWSEMPDLDLANEAVRAEFADIARFWLEKGAAGFRLDAVKHIFHERADNIEFLRWFGETCREVKPEVYIVAEVWSGESEVLAYYESGLSAFFAFPFAGAGGLIHGSVQAREGASLASGLENFTGKIKQRNPSGLFAPFLSNHDTDRSAGYIPNPDIRKLEAAVYLLTPGTPFIYYGEEIAMTGAGADENKRRPMDWSAVERDLSDPGSLLNYYRALLALRGAYPGDFQTGEAVNLKAPDRRICALSVGDVVILHNLSGDSVDVDFGALAPGKTPAGAPFAPAGDGSIAPYATVVFTGPEL
jgi:alpha-amylase